MVASNSGVQTIVHPRMLDKWFHVDEVDGIHVREASVSQKIREISLDPELRDRFLLALQDKSLDYVDILRAYGVVDGLEADHLRLHWFPPVIEMVAPTIESEVTGIGLAKTLSTRAWWPNLQPIVGIIRGAMIRAFEAAQQMSGTPADPKPPVPIDFYWIITTGTDPKVSAGHVVQGKRILFYRMTPEPPSPTKYDRSMILGIMDNFDYYFLDKNISIMRLFDKTSAFSGNLIPGQTPSEVMKKADIKTLFQNFFDSVESNTIETHHEAFDPTILNVRPQIVGEQVQIYRKYTLKLKSQPTQQDFYLTVRANLELIPTLR